MSGTGERGEPARSWEPIFVVLLALVALGLRLGVALQYEHGHPLADRPVIDEASYEDWALEIARGDGLGDEVFFQEPLYPYWLGVAYAVLGPENRTGVRHLQVSLGVLTVLGIWWLTRRFFGVEAAVVAGVAAATYRPALLFPSLLLKPNLVLPVLVALLLALDRARRGSAWRWWVVGAVAGAGALLRGNVLLLLPLLALFPLWRAWSARRPLASAAGPTAAFVLGVSAALLPVVVRNAVVGGRFVLTTSGAGTNVYGGNNAYNLDGVATEFPWVRGIPRHEADDWRHEAERRLGRGPADPLEPDEVSRFWLAETWRSVVADPALHLGILWRKLRLTLGPYEVPDNHALEWDARYVPLLRWPLPGFGLWGWAGMAGLLLWALRPGALGGERASPAVREAAVLFVAYVGTIVLTVVSMRIRLALLPLLLPFAGALAAGGLRLWRRSPRAPAPALLAVSAAVPLVFVLELPGPVFTAEERSEELDERDFNYAVYLLEEGDRAAAGAIAERLDEKYPGSSRVLALRAELELREALELRSDAAPGSAEWMEGERLLARALARLRPVLERPGVVPREVFRARALSGRIEEALGDRDAAAEHYRRALAFDAEDPYLLAGFANALLDSAERELEEGRRLRREHPGGSPEERRGRELVASAFARARVVCETPGVGARELLRARLLAGSVQEYLGDWRVAERHYRVALELEPESALALTHLASALLAQIGDEPDPAAARALGAEAEDLLERVQELGLGTSALEERLELLRRTGR